MAQHISTFCWMYNTHLAPGEVGLHTRALASMTKNPTGGENYVAKFFLLIAVFIIAYLVINSSARRRQFGNQRPKSKAEKPASEYMVQCDVCGIHSPRSESLTSDGKYFCSKEHQRIANNGE